MFIVAFPHAIASTKQSKFVLNIKLSRSLLRTTCRCLYILHRCGMERPIAGEQMAKGLSRTVNAVTIGTEQNDSDGDRTRERETHC